jgi:hypothetical protein
MQIKPVIGQPVQYHRPDRERPLPALVTHVADDRHVDLVFFTGGPAIESAQRVPYGELGLEAYCAPLPQPELYEPLDLVEPTVEPEPA